MFKSAVILSVFFLCFRDILPYEASDDFLLLFQKLFPDGLFLSHHIVKGFPITQIDSVTNLMDCHNGYKDASVNHDKVILCFFLNLLKRHSYIVDVISQRMNICNIPIHCHVENGVYSN